jgi:hypothetical protein
MCVDRSRYSACGVINAVRPPIRRFKHLQLYGYFKAAVGQIKKIGQKVDERKADVTDCCGAWHKSVCTSKA